MPNSLRFRLDYWKDGDWYVGRLPQVPGVFSQGSTLQELEDGIRDAYRLMLEDQAATAAPSTVQTKEIEVPA
ncbi:MAG TPA: type II toxin-antitoxin system HicB family antitoxin [Bryobacteraceae bacterium]|nr:type II toxin-antitoxin system HicB family antitoxin [Bryobacteraceae bacterium]